MAKQMHDFEKNCNAREIFTGWPLGILNDNII